MRKGFVFESETDTEVIPKLTKYLFDKFHTRVSFRQLVMVGEAAHTRVMTLNTSPWGRLTRDDTGILPPSLVCRLNARLVTPPRVGGDLPRVRL